ncbi:SulA-like leucine-rich domain-containing protein [Teredinibacter haidensis]|uniref:SulA-like leucine-rich domain-containing protein n=1 Tax=Teredinibacter haidensis TaxID=2731755 RepID=UPI000948ACAE|nr:SulA-like leucine-rich domain-containing protein [Teredinibacter haidensis]
MAIPAPHTLQATPKNIANAELRDQSASLTEIVLTRSHLGENDYSLVMPMLAHLSQQSQTRWFTWIAPKGVTKGLLSRYRFNLEKVRVVYADTPNDILWLYWEALANGNSDTVVAEVSSLTDSEFSKLESACNQGLCRGLTLRFR